MKSGSEHKEQQLLGEKEWLLQDSDELEAEIRNLERALGGQNRNQRDSSTQTDALAVDLTGEVDNAADARPEAAAAAPAAGEYCSVCLRSVQNIPGSAVRRHLEACRITASDCVVFTAD